MVETDDRYRPRLIDSELRDSLEAFGAVLITGPKWCGKTTTASRFARSILRLQDTSDLKTNMMMAEYNPMMLLEGDKPRLIDEWQDVPVLWDTVRTSVDDIGKEGLYILTGSTEVDWDQVKHSGAGRIYRLKMRTMSLLESGDSNGSVSLSKLFDGLDKVSGTSDLDYGGIASIIVRGGWPKTIGRNERFSKLLIRGYCEAILTAKVRTDSGYTRDEVKMKTLLRALSRQISAPLSKEGIMKDAGGLSVSMSPNTLNKYLEALTNICVYEPLYSWNPNLRSSTTIRTAETVHFCDPAIAAYFLSSSPSDMMNDPNTFGLLFESLVIRDLRVYAGSMGGEVFHYRDKTGLEADAVIHLDDGRWAAIEVKLSENWVDDAAKNLNKLRSKVDTDHMGEPAFLAVITATKYAYTRSDGVHVIPIACLGI